MNAPPHAHTNISQFLFYQAFERLGWSQFNCGQSTMRKRGIVSPKIRPWPSLDQFDAIKRDQEQGLGLIRINNGSNRNKICELA